MTNVESRSSQIASAFTACCLCSTLHNRLVVCALSVYVICRSFCVYICNRLERDLIATLVVFRPIQHGNARHPNTTASAPDNSRSRGRQSRHDVVRGDPSARVDHVAAEMYAQEPREKSRSASRDKKHRSRSAAYLNRFAHVFNRDICLIHNKAPVSVIWCC